MFMPPSPKKDRFSDLFDRFTLKTEIASQPPEICTRKTYHRWLYYEIGGLVVLALLGFPLLLEFLAVVKVLPF